MMTPKDPIPLVPTAPRLPEHLTAQEVEAVLNFAFREGRDETIVQATLNDLKRKPLPVALGGDLEILETSLRLPSGESR